MSAPGAPALSQAEKVEVATAVLMARSGAITAHAVHPYPEAAMLGATRRWLSLHPIKPRAGRPPIPASR